MRRDPTAAEVVLPYVVPDTARPNPMYRLFEDLYVSTQRLQLATRIAAKQLQREHALLRHAIPSARIKPCVVCSQWERIWGAVDRSDSAGGQGSADACTAYRRAAADADELVTAIRQATYNIEHEHEAVAHTDPNAVISLKTCRTCGWWDEVWFCVRAVERLR